MLLLVKLASAYQHSGRCPSPFSAPWTSAEWREWSWRHSAAWACWNEWSLLKWVEVSMISWHVDNRDMISNCSHQFLEPEDEFCHIWFSEGSPALLCMHKTIKDDHVWNDVQLLLTQKLNSCLARSVGPLVLEQIVRSAEGNKVWSW